MLAGHGVQVLLTSLHSSSAPWSQDLAAARDDAGNVPCRRARPPAAAEMTAGCGARTRRMTVRPRLPACLFSIIVITGRMAWSPMHVCTHCTTAANPFNAAALARKAARGNSGGGAGSEGWMLGKPHLRAPLAEKQRYIQVRHRLPQGSVKRASVASTHGGCTRPWKRGC